MQFDVSITSAFGHKYPSEWTETATFAELLETFQQSVGLVPESQSCTPTFSVLMFAM
jgi:hypothetical protein